MLDAHRRAWFRADVDPSLDQRQTRSARAQYERRMWASGIIGMLGLLLMVRPLVPRDPLWFTLYLLMLVLLCGILILLALIDGFAASLRIRRARQQTESTRQKLERELQSARNRSEEPEQDTNR